MNPRAATDEARSRNDSKALSMSDYQIMSMRQAEAASESGATHGQGNWRALCLGGLAVIVEHWKVIVVATLVAGVLAYGVCLLLPKVYTSIAYLGPLEETNAKATEVVIQSAPVLDPVIEKF